MRPSRQPRVYDCFIFFNELDVLEIRLTELADVVDRFVLVEATRTFTGIAKPLHFADNMDRFRPFLDRIVHVVVKDLPTEGASAWDREAMQRDAIMRGLTDAHPTDRIIISDADELPKPDQLRGALGSAMLHRRLIAFWCDNYLHRLNLRHQDFDFRLGPRLITFANLASPEQIRVLPVRASKRPWTRPITPVLAFPRVIRRLRRVLWPTIIWHGAWHFSSIGTVESFHAKLAAFSHTEYNLPDVYSCEAIETGIREGCSVITGQPLVHEDLAVLPRAIQSNPARYAHLLA